jgi:hypothetical protein
MMSCRLPPKKAIPLIFTLSLVGLLSTSRDALFTTEVPLSVSQEEPSSRFYNVHDFDLIKPQPCIDNDTFFAGKAPKKGKMYVSSFSARDQAL